MPVLGAPPTIGVNFKHDCVNGCRCFPTVSSCSFALGFPVHNQSEGELVADVGFGRW